MPSLTSSCHKATLNRESLKLPKRDRPLTPEKQALAAQYLPMSMKMMKQLMANFPRWLMNLIGDEWKGAALEALCYAANTKIKKRGKITTHLRYKCKGCLSRLVYRTLVVSGGCPDSNNRSQAATVKSLSSTTMREVAVCSSNGHTEPEELASFDGLLFGLRDDRIRAALKLRFSDGLEYAEIGKRLNMSKEWARKLVKSGLGILRGSSFIRREYDKRVG